MHSLALALTLSLNHLPNEQLRTNSPLYGLIYCSVTDVHGLCVMGHVFGSLSVKEGGRERVHCTLIQ